MASRFANLSLVVMFLAAISAPGLGFVLGIDRSRISEAEMRELAPPPAWAWQPSSMAAWPGAFRRYFEAVGPNPELASLSARSHPGSITIARTIDSTI